MCPASKSNARRSASSSTPSGRETAVTHRSSRRANSQFVFLISRNARSYVASSVDGNSSRARRIHPGRHPARYSSWQCTHRNLRCVYECREEIQYKNALHPVCSFCQNINHKLLVHRCPSSHPSVRVYDRLDVVLNVFFLSALVV